MKVIAYSNFGDYTHCVDVEFNSESVLDCNQADKYISRVLTETEVKEDAEA